MSQNGLYLEQMIKSLSPLSRRLTLIDRRRHRFVVNENLWGKEVADAARLAEQARHGKEMSRMAGLRTTQEVTNNVSEDTQKIIYELEEAICDLARRNNMMAQESGKGTSKQH